MSLELLIQNLSNPTLLFFFLGLLAVRLKSDLEIPANSSKFISIYLLFSIGFKGGQELAHSTWSIGIAWSLLFGVMMAFIVPLYTFFILKKKVGVMNAGAIAASYGSVSAVTFITAISFLDLQNIEYGSYMVAVMALMEAPAILVGVLLICLFKGSDSEKISLKSIARHSMTNGSVLLILGSLLIGIFASESQAQGIKPFTTDIFNGFLALFLLDMGIESGKRISGLWENGWFPFVFAVVIPLMNGVLVAIASGWITSNPGDQLLFAILTASASYIAVPASMKIAVPQANPGLYIPMAIAITFPFNITFGIPLYFYLIQMT